MDNRTIEEVRINEDRFINRIELLEQENQKLKKALKEFVEWLEKEISSLEEESQMDCINSMLLYDVERDEHLYKKVLSKHKEIVDVDEE